MKLKLVKKELLHFNFFNKKLKEVKGTENLTIGTVFDAIYVTESHARSECIKLFLTDQKQWISVWRNADCSESILQLFEPA